MTGFFEDPKEREGFENWSKKYPSDKDRAKAFNHMRSSFDQRVALPAENATPEDWSKFYQKLGQPATSKEYTFNWGERKPTDEETARLEGFKEVAHKFNLSQRQLEGLVAWNNQSEDQMTQAAIDQMDAFQDQTVEFLKKEWGADFANNQEYVRAVGVQFADDQKEWQAFTDMKIMSDKGMMRVGDHPQFNLLFAKIGRLFAEDTRARENEMSGEAASLKAQIEGIEQEAIRAGKMPSEEPYHSKLTPLYAKLYPKKHKGNVY